MALYASFLPFAITLAGILSTNVVSSTPCYRNTTSCVPVNSTNCLTTKITFTHTSTEFLQDSLSLAEIEAELETWSLLRGVPECWAVVQPFLCSVYVPKCESGDQKVERPSRELCERVRSPCEIVKRYNGSWPWFLQCDEDFYAENCGQTFFEQASFDTDGRCNSPLVLTADESTWFGDVRGCGMQCQSPLYTENEHNIAHMIVAVICVLCLICTLFTLLTFVIDWKVGRKYPAVILFFINGCFFLACVGWLLQLGNRDDVVCRKDGTIRQGEPMIGSGESASCTVVFILVYYFTLAGVAWFVMLAYSWDVTFKAIGTVRDDLSKKTAYFHIVCWCLPLVLTIVVLSISESLNTLSTVGLVYCPYSWDETFKAIGTVRDDLSKKTAYFHNVCWFLPLVLMIVVLSISEIDGDSVSGICFPGYHNDWVRLGFVLAPIALVLILGTIFSVRGLITLIKVRKDTPPFISDKATSKIKETIVRLVVFIIVAFVLVFVTTGVHVSQFVSRQGWEDSLEQYTYCRANVSVMQILYGEAPGDCELESRPSIMAALLHVFAFFGAALAMSSWSWTKSSLDAWERFFRKLCNKPAKTPAKMRKGRIVARTFKRRKKRNKERLSLSYGTDQDDPVGLKFDRSSMSSQSLSSGFAVAMPKFGRGRGPRLVRPGTGRPGTGVRRYSDSDLGSLHSRRSRRVSSRSSRQESYESSMSQKLSDIEREIRREERRKRRVKRRKKRQNRVQPILEPISSTMAALQAHRLRRMRELRQLSESSESQMSAGHVNLIAAEIPHHTWPLDSSTVLSESVTTGNSISELELPHQGELLEEEETQEPDHHQNHPHTMPDFSMFTANTMLPPAAADNNNKGDNSNNTHPNNLKKGANPSPSGSFRRGRRREVKLEMTETSFYQEDEDNIEMAGNQTIHCEENCHEAGEISRQNLKELGPLVNEMFQRARANSGSGRSTNGRNSYQRDPMGSGRLGSASSRGSKGSRGSQTNPKEPLRYANTKVTVPERPMHDPHARGRNRRPFSGDYVLVGRRNDARADSEVRKSRSQPGSATSHKRQIGHNGRIGFESGLSWSRFLQDKGYNPGQIFTRPQHYHKGQRSRLLPIMDTSHFANQTQGPVGGENAEVLNMEAEQNHFGYYDNHGADVNNLEELDQYGCHDNSTAQYGCHDNPAGYHDNSAALVPHSKHLRLPQNGADANVFNVEQEHFGKGKLRTDGYTGLDGNVNKKLRTESYTGLGGDVNVLNIEEEQQQLLQQTNLGFQYNPNINLSHVNVSDDEKQIRKQKHKSGQKPKPKHQGQDKHGKADVLNLDEERVDKSINVLNLEEERENQSVNVLNLDDEWHKQSKGGKNLDEKKTQARNGSNLDEKRRKQSRDAMVSEEARKNLSKNVLKADQERRQKAKNDAKLNEQQRKQSKASTHGEETQKQSENNVSTLEDQRKKNSKHHSNVEEPAKQSKVSNLDEEKLKQSDKPVADKTMAAIDLQGKKKSNSKQVQPASEENHKQSKDKDKNKKETSKDKKEKGNTTQTVIPASKDKKDKGHNTQTVIATSKDKKGKGNTTQAALAAEEQRHLEKEMRRLESLRQRELEAVRQRDRDALKHRERDALRQRGIDPNSKLGRYYRYAHYNGRGPGSGSTLSSDYDRRLEESTIVPGNEGKRDLLNLVDYEFDSEYTDFTDDLTDTYTYTDYDDDLTEVSSLPC